MKAYLSMQTAFSVKNISSVVMILMLGTMAVLMLGSSWNDSMIMDELAHIPAGYSYWTQQDYRLNPEHPPLAKMFATAPLLFQHIVFPSTSPHWTEDVNGQWDFGRDFFAANNPDPILFWSRIPIMLLSLLTGWFLFRFVRRRFGAGTALLTLTLFVFSPTIIAHSRFVTTDLPALFGFLIGIFSYIEFLETPTWKKTVFAGICFGIAELMKFSLVLLIPMYIIIWFGWALARGGLIEGMRIYCGKFFALLAIGAAVIWPVYQYTVWHYPPERQQADARFILGSFDGGAVPLSAACASLAHIKRCPAELVVWAADKPVLRPFAQYLLGVLMVTQRAAGGNTAYFLGDVTNVGSRWYFPIAFLLKEPIPTLILIAIACVLAIRNIRRAPERSWRAVGGWIRGHLTEFSALVMIAVYWGFSIKSPLNIGIRHVMPTFPYIYLLTAVRVAAWMRGGAFTPRDTVLAWIGELWRVFVRTLGRYFVLYVLLLWLVAGTIFSAPAYLSYFNAFAGGTANGYRYIVDSNYDWGQDLKRLSSFVDKRDINSIALDYFGGSDPRHYLGDRFVPWWSARGPAHGWFAVSATFRQGAFGTPTDGFVVKPEDRYDWLKPYAPVARAGESIFIYHLP